MSELGQSPKQEKNSRVARVSPTSRQMKWLG